MGNEKKTTAGVQQYVSRPMEMWAGMYVHFEEQCWTSYTVLGYLLAWLGIAENEFDMQEL